MTQASENHCYAAMNWLLARQDRIQKKLAARHLIEGGLILYDLSSSYFKGSTCPLAKRGSLGAQGDSRDGKHGTLQVEYGLMTDGRGCPVAVAVHDGNVADPTTLMPEIQRLTTDFGIEQFVMVGDRGMNLASAIDAIREQEGIDWITALKGVSIRALVNDGQWGPSALFAPKNSWYWRNLSKYAPINEYRATKPCRFSLRRYIATMGYGHDSQVPERALGKHRVGLDPRSTRHSNPGRGRSREGPSLDTPPTIRHC